MGCLLWGGPEELLYGLALDLGLASSSDSNSANLRGAVAVALVVHHHGFPRKKGIFEYFEHFFAASPIDFVSLAPTFGSSAFVLASCR